MKKTQTRPIREIVISYEAACELTGTTPLTIEDFAKHPIEDQDSDFASHQINVISKAFWQGREIEYSSGKQRKYWPYHYWNERLAGGPGFSYLDCDSGGGTSASYVGARHSFPSSDDAIYAGKQFEDIYNRFLAPFKPTL